MSYYNQAVDLLKQSGQWDEIGGIEGAMAKSGDRGIRTIDSQKDINQIKKVIARYAPKPAPAAPAAPAPTTQPPKSVTQPFNPEMYSPVPENPSEGDGTKEKIDTSSRGASNFVENYLTSFRDAGNELGSTFKGYIEGLTKRNEAERRSEAMGENSYSDYSDQVSERFGDQERTSQTVNSQFTASDSGSSDSGKGWDQLANEWGYGTNDGANWLSRSEGRPSKGSSSSKRKAGSDAFLDKLKQSSGLA